VVDFNEAIDHGPAAPAASTCTTGFPNLVFAAGTGVDASSDRLIANRMAVANQHVFFITRRS
jgi:hypothetical protein